MNYQTTITLDERELATVLASLRFYQRNLLGGPSTFASYPESDIATDEGKLVPLTDTEIDTLCEELNQ